MLPWVCKEDKWEKLLYSLASMLHNGATSGKYSIGALMGGTPGEVYEVL